MKEQIIEIVKFVALWVSAIVSSGAFTMFVKKIVVNLITKKMEEVSPTNEYKQLRIEIAELKKEIMLLRGKSE